MTQLRFEVKHTCGHKTLLTVQGRNEAECFRDADTERKQLCDKCATEAIIARSHQ